jgi:hypothetical protein
MTMNDANGLKITATSDLLRKCFAFIFYSIFKLDFHDPCNCQGSSVQKESWRFNGTIAHAREHLTLTIGLKKKRITAHDCRLRAKNRVGKITEDFYLSWYHIQVVFELQINNHLFVLFYYLTFGFIFESILICAKSIYVYKKKLLKYTFVP